MTSGPDGGSPAAVQAGATFPSRKVGCLGPLVVLAAVTGLWYLMSEALLPPHKRFLLPPPHAVIRDGFLVWRTGERRGLQPILLSLWDSSKVAIVGLVIAVIVGIALAVMMNLSRWVAQSTWPYLVAIQSAPILALTPLIRALLDDVTTQRTLVVVIVAFFPIVSNTLFGLQSVEPAFHDMFTLHGASRVTRLLRLEIPSALPQIFVGLRISAGLAVIGAIVGDIYFRQGGVVGIGAQIDVYRSRLWGPELIAAVISASMLGIGVFLFFGWLGRRVTGKWTTESRNR